MNIRRCRRARRSGRPTVGSPTGRRKPTRWRPRSPSRSERPSDLTKAERPAMEHFGRRGGPSPAMQDWTLTGARDRVALDVYDPLGLGREAEPVEVTLRFGVARPAADGLAVVDDEGQPVASQVIASAA